MFHVCGITTSDQAICWGSTALGAAAYRPVPGSSFRDVQAGLDYSCGITLEWGMLCWGGALPAGSPTSVRLPEPLTLYRNPVSP